MSSLKNILVLSTALNDADAAALDAFISAHIPQPAEPLCACKDRPASRCANCGGRDIPWGHGKCHCFKTKGSNDSEHHGADAKGVAQDGRADASASREGAGPGANLGDEHRGPAPENHGHSGYSLGNGVRLPDEAAIRESIELTPVAEPLDEFAHPAFAASEGAASLAVPEGMVLVPREPTRAMRTAFYEVGPDDGFMVSYAAMLAAAPQPEPEEPKVKP